MIIHNQSVLFKSDILRSMRKIKAFVHVFINSLVSTKYYNEIVQTSLSFSLKYLFAITVFAATLTTLLTSIPAMPQVKNDMEEFLGAGKDIFPKDLEIQIKSGKMKINQPEPLFIKMPQVWAAEANMPLNLVVFDSNGTLDDVAKHKTMALVNTNNILFGTTESSGRVSTEVYPLKEVPDQTITRADFDALMQDLRSFTKYIPVFLVGLIFALSLAYFFAFRAIYLIFVGVALMLVGTIKKSTLTFKQYYKIGLHAMTFPLLVELIVKVANIPLEISMWFFTLNLIIGIIVLFEVISVKKVE